MKKYSVFLLMLFLVSFFAFGCGGGELPTPKAGEYYEISVDKLQELIDKKDPNLVILDVRTPEEFNSGHVPGAQLLPLDNLEAGMAQLDKTKTYTVICLSGERSAFASRILAQNGFTRVYNVSGGMNVWKGQVETVNQ